MAASALSSDLSIRTATGLVLSAAVGLAILMGGAAYGLLLLMALAVLMWEWTELTMPLQGARIPKLLVACSVAAVCGGFLNYLQGDDGVLQAAPIGLALVGWIGGIIWMQVSGVMDWQAWWRRYWFLHMLWPIWIVVPIIAAFLIRDQLGASALLFPLLVVVSSDIGAYVCGRAIGGPKLAPRFSPKKTWSGFLGGVVAGVSAGLLFDNLVGPVGSIPPLWTALALSVASVLGDLAQSAVKRHAGRKDSGSILPGHGGVFDRLDSHLFAIPVFAVIAYVTRWPA
jgi:phosphatidate cytidylyltransferase